jgi:xylose isomerase
MQRSWYSSFRRAMTDSFTPRPEHQFTFGLWTVGNPGRDPFGEAVRPPLDPVDSVHRLADLGTYGVSFHDNDLVPAHATDSDRQDIVKRFRRALDATGMHVPMVTTNLFWRPIFKEGAFTANDRRVRRFAVRKACEAVELGAEFGGNVFVLWGGREGMETEAAKDVRLALDRGILVSQRVVLLPPVERDVGDSIAHFIGGGHPTLLQALLSWDSAHNDRSGAECSDGDAEYP